MPLPKAETSVGHSFGLEIDGVVIKQIQELSDLKLEQDVIELKMNTADGKFVIKKLPGRFKAGEVTFTRGLTKDQSFEKWLEASRFGQRHDARKGGSIIIYDFEGTAIRRLKLEKASVKSLESLTLKAGDTSVLTEKLVLHFEGLVLE